MNTSELGRTIGKISVRVGKEAGRFIPKVGEISGYVDRKLQKRGQPAALTSDETKLQSETEWNLLTHVPGSPIPESVISTEIERYGGSRPDAIARIETDATRAKVIDELTHRNSGI